MYIFKNQDIYNLVYKLGEETNQKGNELFFKYCPYCSGGNHRDKNTFSINLDNGTFKCFRASCGRQGHFVEMARDFNYPLEHEDNKYRTLPQKKLIPTDLVKEYLKNRGISDNIINKYCVSSQKTNPNIMVFPFYDDNDILQFVKYRPIKKIDGRSKEWAEKNTKPILFGMNHVVNDNELIITEGQIDCLSIAECGFNNVVSVPMGCKNFNWVSNCLDWVRKFKKIIVFGDNENGAITLVQRLEELLKIKVFAVDSVDYLQEKDANDILVKYGKEAIITAIRNAKIKNLKSVKQLSDVDFVDVMALPKIKTGFRDFDDEIGGFYLGQFIILSGKRGEGKSTFLSQIIANVIDDGEKVFIYSGELANHQFKYWLYLQVAGNENIINTGKDLYLDKETIKRIDGWCHDKAYIFDNRIIDNEEPLDLIKIIEEVILIYDVKMVCLDNLMTALIDNLENDYFRKQSKFVTELSKLAKKYNVIIILVAHPRKTNGNFNNDDVSGSSNVTNLADVVLNFGRATEEEEEEEGYNNYLSVMKNRLTGTVLYENKSIKIIYSKRSKRMQSKKYKDKKIYRCFLDSNLEDIDVPF